MTTEQATATELAKAADTLRAAAAVHKRSAVAHKRAARELMRAFSDLRAHAARMGVEINLTTRPTGGEVDHEDHHRS